MQPHGAQWKPNPQPSRTNVMNAAVDCGRTDESGEACALIEKDDASTPQVRTNDNLLNIDKTPLLAAFLGTLSCAVGNGSTRRRFLSKSQAVSSGFSLRMVDCWLEAALACSRLNCTLADDDVRELRARPNSRVCDLRLCWASAGIPNAKWHCGAAITAPSCSTIWGRRRGVCPHPRAGAWSPHRRTDR